MLETEHSPPAVIRGVLLFIFMNEKAVVRDLRNGDWHWVNNAVTADPHLTAAEARVYSALSTFGGCEEIRPAFPLIAERAAQSERTVKAAVKKLVEVGYVRLVQGGGRGRANVYELLKASKGCKICTESEKQCKERPETVQNTTIKGAKSALQLNKELNNNNITISSADAEEVKTVFSQEEYLNTLRPTVLNKITKTYIRFKGLQFENKKQLSAAFPRLFKAAKALEGYGYDDVVQTMEYCEKEYGPGKWTLETVGKRIYEVKALKSRGS